MGTWNIFSVVRLSSLLWIGIPSELDCTSCERLLFCFFNIPNDTSTKFLNFCTIYSILYRISSYTLEHELSSNNLNLAIYLAIRTLASLSILRLLMKMRSIHSWMNCSVLREGGSAIGSCWYGKAGTYWFWLWVIYVLWWDSWCMPVIL